MFLYYNLDNRYDELRSLSTGDGGRGGLNLKILRDLDISLPPLDEQKQIATVLSDTDKLIESLEKLIEKKKNIKQGTMQQLLSGKKRLEGFSKKWNSVLLGEVTNIKTGSKNNQDKKSNGKYPFFVRSQEIEKIDTYTYDCEAILVPGEGGIGKIIHYIQGKFDVHQRVYKISDFSKVNGKFIFFYMNIYFHDHAMKNTVKATVDSLRLPTFQNFKMFIPVDVSEQKAIAKILSDMDNEIDALEKKLNKYKQIKQGMMQELLTGRIRLV